MAFILRVIDEILDDLEGTADVGLKIAVRSGEEDPGQSNGKLASPPFEVAGVAASGTADALTMRMLGQIIVPSNCTLVNLEGAGTPMQLAERVAEMSPAMVILSHLPPEPLAQARYQVRRLRARFAALPIVVGRWGRAAATPRPRGFPESDPRAWRSRWPMPAIRSWPGRPPLCRRGWFRRQRRRRKVEPNGESAASPRRPLASNLGF